MKIKIVMNENKTISLFLLGNKRHAQTKLFQWGESTRGKLLLRHEWDYNNNKGIVSVANNGHSFRKFCFPTSFALNEYTYRTWLLPALNKTVRRK